MGAQVWKHESVKSGNSLVGATACMVGGILSHHHEMRLKAPVGITCVRGFLVLAETYRLTIALRLHAIQMVRNCALEMPLKVSGFCALSWDRKWFQLLML